MKNKKIKVFVGIMIIVSSILHASVYIPKNQRVTFDKLSAEEIKLYDLDMVARKHIPAKYINSFMYYTEGKSDNDTLNLRISILALGILETGWKPLVSKPNKNGSVDKGYLQLNSFNIKDKWFMNRFGPNKNDIYKYDTEDEEELYLITCIKFYKALRNLYGDDAAYCYNCGEARYRRGQIPSASYNYKKKMSRYVSDIISEIEAMKHDREDFENASFRSINIKYSFTELGQIVQFRVGNYLDSSVTVYELTKFIKKNNKEEIFQILKKYTRPNNKYVFVGYIKKTGATTPVFKNNKTQALVIC